MASFASAAVCPAFAAASAALFSSASESLSFASATSRAVSAFAISVLALSMEAPSFEVAASILAFASQMSPASSLPTSVFASFVPSCTSALTSYALSSAFFASVAASFAATCAWSAIPASGVTVMFLSSLPSGVVPSPSAASAVSGEDAISIAEMPIAIARITFSFLLFFLI